MYEVESSETFGEVEAGTKVVPPPYTVTPDMRGEQVEDEPSVEAPFPLGFFTNNNYKEEVEDRLNQPIVLKFQKVWLRNLINPASNINITAYSDIDGKMYEIMSNRWSWRSRIPFMDYYTLDQSMECLNYLIIKISTDEGFHTK